MWFTRLSNPSMITSVHVSNKTLFKFYSLLNVSSGAAKAFKKIVNKIRQILRAFTNNARAG